ncbi:MAG: hypothetical protein M1829_000750 [Trizodia sp. TS-e1964]|nr:MAG: hypothetical protein M1829_000750 [Trizodia sp. TS-e1964]
MALKARLENFMTVFNSYPALALQKFSIDISWELYCFQGTISNFEDVDNVFFVSSVPDFDIRIRNGNSVLNYRNSDISSEPQLMDEGDVPKLRAALDIDWKIQHEVAILYKGF